MSDRPDRLEVQRSLDRVAVALADLAEAVRPISEITGLHTEWEAMNFLIERMRFAEDRIRHRFETMPVRRRAAAK